MAGDAERVCELVGITANSGSDCLAASRQRSANDQIEFYPQSKAARRQILRISSSLCSH